MASSQEAFEQFVTEGIAAIPEEFRRRIKNVTFLIEDEPTAEVRSEEGLQPGEMLLGYYHGIPNNERGDRYGIGPTLPDTITLYRLPIEKEAGGDEKLLKEVISDTVWHEVGHYLGLSEQEIRRRELKRSHERDKLSK